MFKSTKQIECTTCAKELHGRIDKRFCSTKCKNKHHREAKKIRKALLKTSNRNQIRNYIILYGIFGVNTRKIKIHRDLLFYYGFDVRQSGTLINIRDKEIYSFSHFRIRYFQDGMVEIENKRKPKTVNAVFYNRWKADFREGLEISPEIQAEKRNFNFSRTVYFDSEKPLAY